MKLVQRFPHGLPRNGPVVPAFAVAQVNVPPRLITRVEAVAQDAPVRPGPDKAVAARVVGKDGAVLRRTEVIRPRRRRVRPGNHIFPGCFIKITVFHTVLRMPIFLYHYRKDFRHDSHLQHSRILFSLPPLRKKSNGAGAGVGNCHFFMDIAFMFLRIGL